MPLDRSGFAGTQEDDAAARKPGAQAVETSRVVIASGGTSVTGSSVTGMSATGTCVAGTCVSGTSVTGTSVTGMSARTPGRFRHGPKEAR
ncbi:hypothetical protein [Burkholderia sp. IMCC1007]|uniref:hypothetical protein n=1 Tax=Burkholderia sp. IMCC1007 TaxID=3004104 RepID=UPI0022B461E5|nr:hypothetical protein [Burkholderia sp. IMCC1007]